MLVAPFQTGILLAILEMVSPAFESSTDPVTIRHYVGNESADWTTTEVPRPSTASFEPASSATFTIIYSTFFGGSSGENAAGGSLVADDDGNVYVLASSRSIDLPGAPSALAGDGRIGFIAKFNPGGELDWITTYGGDHGAATNAAVIDEPGNIYIVGSTVSANFPVLDPFQDTHLGDGDAFIMKLNASGELIWSTFLGGDKNDEAVGVEVDQNGRPVIVGGSTSDPSEGRQDLRDLGAFPTSSSSMVGTGGGDEIFVVSFNPDGSGFSQSFFVGGADNEDPKFFGLAPDGGYVIAGESDGRFGMPLANAFQPQYGGGDSDMFVMKVLPDGSGLAFSTYLGGSDTDQITSLVVTSSGHAVVTGTTNSTDLTLVDPLVAGFDGPGFTGTMTDFEPDGSVVFTGYAPLIVRYADEGPEDVIALSGTGSVPPVDPLPGNASSGAFVSVFDRVARTFTFSSNYATGVTQGNTVAGNRSGDVFLMGTSIAGDIPLVNAFQDQRGGAQDLFLTRLSEGAGSAIITAEPDLVLFTQVRFGQVAREEIAIRNSGTEPIELTSISVSPSPPFGLEGHPEGPVTLGPGDELSFFVVYAPSQEQRGKTANDEGLLEFYSTFGLLDEIQIRTVNVTDIPVIGIIRDELNLESHPGDSRLFTGLTVEGSGLDQFDELVFDGTELLAVENAEFTAGLIRFDVSLTGPGLALPGVYDLYMGSSSLDMILNVTDMVGARFIVTEGQTEFNQAVAARRLEAPFTHVLVADKRGVVRLQLTDEDLVGETFAASLVINESTQSIPAERPYTVRSTYTREQRLGGEDYLTFEFTEPTLGVNSFDVALERQDGRKIIGPTLRRQTVQSRRLNILAISYRVPLPGGGFLEPMSEIAVESGLTRFAGMYPISEDHISVTFVPGRLLPAAYQPHEAGFNGETIHVLDGDDQIRLLRALGRAVAQSGAEAILESLGVDRHIDIALAILPERTLYRDDDGDGEIDRLVEGRADSDRRSIVVTREAGLGQWIAHEVGHVIQSAVQDQLPAGAGGGDLGDEYEGGSFDCDVNPPVNDLIDANGVTCLSDLQNGVSGDETGMYTNDTEYDALSGEALFTDLVSPGGSVIHYNFMSKAVSPGESWVNERAYNLLYRTLIPAEPESLPKKHTTADDPAIRITGFVFADDSVTFDDPASTTMSFRSTLQESDYRIQMRDVSETVLLEHPVAVKFVDQADPPSESDRASFGATVDLPELTRHVVMMRDGVELGRHTLSVNAPEVKNLEVNSDRGGFEVQISWSGSDPDGDSLRYTVLYVPDVGPAVPIETDVTETSLTWNSSGYPSSFTGRIAIVASDGFNLGTADAPIGISIGVAVEDGLPGNIRTRLGANYPNPFNPSTTIEYSLSEAVYTEIAVYNLLGRRVVMLVDQVRPAGTHAVTLDATHLPGGVFFYVMKAGDYRAVRKMALVK